MKSIGYIRSPEDIKFLILYAMCHLTEPLTMPDISEVVLWTDDGFGYFDFTENFFQLVTSGHIAEKHGANGPFYQITEFGQTTALAFQKRLPSSVREHAEKSALGVMRRHARNSQIATSVTGRPPSLDLHLRLGDDREALLGIDLLVASDAQASIIARNFRANAEKIYSEILRILTDIQ